MRDYHARSRRIGDQGHLGGAAVLRTSATARELGLDAVALKPTECDLERARDLPVDRVTIDFEGHEHVPPRDVLADLGTDLEVRLTAPVRADGFDPLGDDRICRELPDGVRLAVVAGHPAYLEPHERRRAIEPRLAAMIESGSEPWVGTEGIESIARGLPATPFELLTPALERELRSGGEPRADTSVAVYAPTVPATDEDVILDAIGDYVARRETVAADLPDDVPTDSRARGRGRRRLLDAASSYALTGETVEIRRRVDELAAAGVDHVVGYPACGLETVVD